MRVFKDLDFVEQLGSGMSRILSTYDKNVFSFTSHFMTVRYDYLGGYTLQGNIQDNTQDDPQDDMTKKILAYCNAPRSKAEITAFCGYKDSKSFAKRYLQPSIESRQLSLTIPEKPTSKNQRYINVSRKEDEQNAESDE